ncbi:hypothetical protein [Mariniradius sediminis]|uniref:DUF2281 domain-containing protein n=1 Tax=Mariniradius sediminis TaxID=2909237 RepID=A0ABS9BQ12_9BACT|nr:hypothetical protein [Mariniradius sediminis]MCF1750092.1 hypothetical protein [Mariniradius sediminis]
METSVHIGFEQLKHLLLQLSPDEIADVKIFLDDLQRAKKGPENKKKLEELLLNGPTLSEDELARIEEARKSIDQWGKK